MACRPFQSASLIASMLGLTSVGVFAESSEKEALENAVAPLEEVVVVGRFLQSEAVRHFALHSDHRRAPEP